MFQAMTTVQTKGGCECRRNTTRAPGRLHDWCRSLLLVVIGISSTGCGGGSGSGSSTNGNTSGNPSSVDRGTVVVTVTDALGAPLAKAEVHLSTTSAIEDKRAVTDSSGRAEFKNVLASTFAVFVQGPDSSGSAPSESLAAGATLAVTVVTMPTAEATGGIARAWVPAGGTSVDGRTLDLALEIVQVNTSGYFGVYDKSEVRVAACTPDATNDLRRFRPDCVAGTGTFDASYEGIALSVKDVSAPGHATPGAATLLIDQGTSVIVNDPSDARLFAAKYFLTLAGTGARAALAAFSSDDAASGQFSLLPQQPVTFFPLENPRFTADGRSYFSAVDQMVALEGGASPLFAAIDRTLDFIAADPQQDAKALVVVTNGRDDTCGTRSECRSILDALIQKSNAAGVAIVAVGLGDAAGAADHETLGLLAQGSANGATLWAPDPRQLTTVFGDVHSFLAGSKDTMEVALRIQSPVAGAFASGRTVIGQVILEACPWDCSYTVIPFVVQIP